MTGLLNIGLIKNATLHGWICDDGRCCAEAGERRQYYPVSINTREARLQGWE